MYRKPQRVGVVNQKAGGEFFSGPRGGFNQGGLQNTTGSGASNSLPTNMNDMGRPDHPGASRTSVHAQATSMNRQMQQFYLHKLFDLMLDAEFLPMIPSDPVSAQVLAPSNYNDAYFKTRGHDRGVQQHIFQKRNDYAQYKSDLSGKERV